MMSRDLFSFDNYGVTGDSFYINYIFENGIDELFDQIVDLHAFTNAMRELRKMYIPQSGGGSQSQDFNYYKELNEAMSSYMKRIEKSYE
jgi:hypothetical protein